MKKASKYNLAILGCGNMGSALLQGILSRKILKRESIIVFDPDGKKALAVKKKCKVSAAASIEEAVSSSRHVMLAMKPQSLPETGLLLKPILNKSHLVISILAGVTIAKLSRFCGSRSRYVRAMPNLGAFVGESMTVISGKTQADLNFSKRLFLGCGQCLVLPEKELDAVTAISGSGPAYFFLLMEQLVAAGVKQGLSAGNALKLVLQTAKGAALLAESSKVDPSALRQQVTSKGGTTEAALLVFEKCQQQKIVHEAVRAAVKRSKEL